jgi:ankyrin repeat protein
VLLVLILKKLFKPSLLEACEKGNIEAVKQHLAAGADVNAKDDHGQTPLHAAAREGLKEVVELLIAAGADVNAKYDDGEGLTPLHFAAVFGGKEIVELLIANGADVNAMNDTGRTPLDYDEGKTTNLLRKHGGKTGEKLKAEGK